jgi:hypothetical protein
MPALAVSKFNFEWCRVTLQIISSSAAYLRVTEVCLIVSFRISRISRGMRKLVQISTVTKIKIKN